MPGADYLALFGGDDDAAANQAQVLADAIRQRRAGGTLASLYGAMAGDKGMAGFGTHAADQADRLENELVGAAQHRAGQALQEKHLGIQEAQMANTLRHQQALEGIATGRLGLAEEALRQRGIRYNPNTGTFENVGGRGGRVSALPGATGAAAPPASVSPPRAASPAPVAPSSSGPTAPAGAPRAQPLAGKMLDKALKELGADFDPSGGRAGEFGKNQARINAATRLLQLATDEQGNPKDLNPQQMPELSQALASLISGGGQGAQAQIEHLTPKTLRGNLQGTLQWLTGDPRGADQVEFVKNMIETAKRERDVAQQGIDQVRSQRGAKHQRVLLGNPEESRRLLQGFGWDLGPDGMPAMKGGGGDKHASLRSKYGL